MCCKHCYIHTHNCLVDIFVFPNTLNHRNLNVRLQLLAFGAGIKVPIEISSALTVVYLSLKSEPRIACVDSSRLFYCTCPQVKCYINCHKGHWGRNTDLRAGQPAVSCSLVSGHEQVVIGFLRSKGNLVSVLGKTDLNLPCCTVSLLKCCNCNRHRTLLLKQP